MGAFFSSLSLSLSGMVSVCACSPACVCVCVGVCCILGVIDVLLGFPLHFLFSSACCGSFGGALDINYRRRRRRRRCRKSTIGPNEGLPMASFFCFYPAFISVKPCVWNTDTHRHKSIFPLVIVMIIHSGRRLPVVHSAGGH